MLKTVLSCICIYIVGVLIIEGADLGRPAVYFVGAVVGIFMWILANGK